MKLESQREIKIMEDIICLAKKLGFYPECSKETWIGTKSVGNII